MLNFTPPPRQQVLYGIRIQAEQARNLVEDLQAGSETASSDLMNLASQILARARLYKWPRLTFWASALEERLAKAFTAGRLNADDIQWFAEHVERLDSVLETPSDSNEEEDQRELITEPDAAATPAPILSDGYESIELDYTLDFDGLDIESAELSLLNDNDDELPESPAEQLTEAQPETISRPRTDPSAIHNELEEAFAFLTNDSESEGSTDESIELPHLSADSIDEIEEVPAEFVEIIEDEPTEPEEGIVDCDIEQRTTPKNGTPSVSLQERFGESVEFDTETEGRATLGKLDIKRHQKQGTITSTEIQGPNQYIVVSVSRSQDMHLWIGRMLPERRFEILAARSAGEAELLCREHQPDLLLIEWSANSDFTQQALARIRENPLTRYLRVILVPDEEDLACHLASIRLDAIGVVPRSADQRTISSRVLLSVLGSNDLLSEELTETSMSELSELLLRELRVELASISNVVGDVVVPVGGALGSVLRETSRKLRDGVKAALGCDGASLSSSVRDDPSMYSPELLIGKRALVMEADRLRRAELSRTLGELGLEVLPPMPDLTKALEAGLAWAPDVFVGGTPTQDSETCVKILRRDIALSSMTAVMVRWPDTGRQWPDAQADMAEMRPWLIQQLSEEFAPSAELQRQLEGEEEVTGRVESYGMLALVRFVMENRSRALLEVAEGTEQFKTMIADGVVLDTIWIEADGTMTAHFNAFARMLTVTRGRFFIRPLSGELPSLNLPGSLTELLTAACHWWRPLGLTIDQQLEVIQPLTLDKRRSSELKRQTGRRFRKIISALSKGSTPAELIAAGFSADIVAHVLRELVRRFAVKELPTPRISRLA